MYDIIKWSFYKRKVFVLHNDSVQIAFILLAQGSHLLTWGRRPLQVYIKKETKYLQCRKNFHL